jgi:hypothetical protein
MTRIDNQQQLAQLRLRYASVEGALAVAQNAQQTAQQLAMQYLDLLGTLTGEHFEQGVRVTVDWKTGEVKVQSEVEHSLNGVAAT